MSTHQEISTDDERPFFERLRQLRIKIDALPPSQRPHLIDLAETIARQHRRLQDKVAQDHDAS